MRPAHPQEASCVPNFAPGCRCSAATSTRCSSVSTGRGSPCCPTRPRFRPCSTRSTASATWLRSFSPPRVEPEVTLEAAQAALDTLIDTGAVVDQAHHLRGSLSEPAWAATWLLVGPEGRAADVVAARTGRCVDVWGSGQVADHLRSLLPRVGLTQDPRTAELIVVAADQEPSRSLSDHVMADGRPHLWAVVRELVGVLGPFVAPGTTACLRCVDRARTHHDPAWPTLVESASLPRGQIHACDPLLATLVATWAALELSLWACDLQPQTWGRTIEIPFGVGNITLQRTEADPACGCGWPLWQDTMGA